MQILKRLLFFKCPKSFIRFSPISFIASSSLLSNPASSLSIGTRSKRNRLPAQSFSRLQVIETFGILNTELGSMPGSHKPPNVFIFTGEEVENEKHFEEVKKFVQLCINSESYILYHLHSSKITQVPWQDNTMAVIISATHLSPSVMGTFKEYLNSGGRVLSLCSNFVIPGVILKDIASEHQRVSSFSYKDYCNVKSIRGHSQMVPEVGPPVDILARGTDSSLPVILKVNSMKGVAVISQVDLAVDAIELSDKDGDFEVLKSSEEARISCLRDILSSHLGLDCQQVTIPPLSPAYLITREGHETFMGKLKPSLSDGKLRLRNLFLKFHSQPCEEIQETVQPLEYPVVITEDQQLYPRFDRNSFYRHLSSRRLGNVLFYADTVTSTMDLLEGFPIDAGAVAIAAVQIKGKGRSGNLWLSPKGCAMFTVQLWIPRDSHLGQSLPLVQQLAAIAVIRAVRTLPWPYTDLDIGLKWPNDLFFARKIKCGGILAASTTAGDSFQCNIGFGINLSNNKPTTCINDLIRLHNKLNGTSMEELSRELFIARTLSCLEELVEQCQAEGTRTCLKYIYQYWIHDGQKLKLSETGEQVIVDGLDNYGFLSVTSESGEQLTLHPDGNSLDQMNNLLIMKKG